MQLLADILARTVPPPGPGAARAVAPRRACPASRAAELPPGASGLPEGISRWRLAAALRGAAPLLGLGPSLLALLALYIDMTRDADWAEDSEPVVPVPVAEVAEALGRSERQVRNIERALAARGLLVWRDSGNLQRRGRRDLRTGRLLWAYGPSLAPLRARAGEILALAARARALRAEGRALRLAIGALRRRLAADLAAPGLDPARAAGLAARLAAIPARAPAGTPHEVLAARRAVLLALRAELAEMTGAAASGLAEIRCPPLPETSPDSSVNGSDPPAPGRPAPCRGSAAPPRNRSPEPGAAPGAGRPPADPAPPPGPARLRRAAGPLLAAAIDAEPPGWAGLAAAAARVAPLLGVPGSLWAHAAARIGRAGAAACLVVLERGLGRSEGLPWPAVVRPAGYFSTLVARSGRDPRHLEAALRALAAHPVAPAAASAAPAAAPPA